MTFAEKTDRTPHTSPAAGYRPTGAAIIWLSLLLAASVLSVFHRPVLSLMAGSARRAVNLMDLRYSQIREAALAACLCEISSPLGRTRDRVRRGAIRASPYSAVAF